MKNLKMKQKNNCIYNAIKRLKYLGINLTKKYKICFLIKNLKTLLKEIKVDINK